MPMRRFFDTACFLVMLAAVGACGYSGKDGVSALKEESEFARNYIERLRAKDYEYVKGLMSPDVASRVNDYLLSRMADYFQGGEPAAITPVDSQVSVINEIWYGKFTFEYEFEAGWNLAEVSLKKTDSGYEVTDVNIYRTGASQREINAFTLSGKTFLHYLILAAAVVVPLFILATIYVCLRTPMRGKWLWALMMLPGVGAVRMNWSSGEYAFELLNVQLLGASAAASGPYASWAISVSAPLAAMLFWLWRKKFLGGGGEADGPDTDSVGVVDVPVEQGSSRNTNE